MIKKEVVSYLIVGVITTVINIVLYHICCNMAGIPNLVSNVIAWIAAVIFAYFANDLLVFKETRGGSLKAQLRKAKLFFGARVFSLLVDEIGMFLLVDWLTVNNMFAKIAMNVIIVVLNYIFSKWFIFKK